MDGDSGVSTTEAIAIALGSGLLGSVLGVTGSFAVAWRADARQRRARLTAMEHELRGNRLVIEGWQSGTEADLRLSDAMWTRLKVDLALDVRKQTHETLASLYFLFADAERICTTISSGEADEKEVKDIKHWHGLCYDSQAFVTGELHLSWRIRTRAMASWNRLKGFIPGSKKEQAQ